MPLRTMTCFMSTRENSESRIPQTIHGRTVAFCRFRATNVARTSGSASVNTRVIRMTLAMMAPFVALSGKMSVMSSTLMRTASTMLDWGVA